MTDFEWKCVCRIRRDCDCIAYLLANLEKAVLTDGNDYDVVKVATKLDYVCDDISDIINSGTWY